MPRLVPLQLGFLLFAATAHGQSPPAEQEAGEEAPTTPSDETARPKRRVAGTEVIVVRGQRPEARSVLNEPQSIGTLDRQELTRSDGLFLESSLNLLPGVRMENRTVAGGQRITIRGYGNATNFNGTGYKAYLNGIPITDAEGTTILDDIDVSTLGAVEVIKGPSSSLCGTGIGGVVKMHTLRPKPLSTRFIQELLLGSDTLYRTNTRIEHASDDSSVVVNYGHQHFDGYRVHSRSNKDYALFLAELKNGFKQSLSAYGAFNHSYEQLAGQLTEAQFLRKDNVAEDAYVLNNGHVTIDSVRLGVSHDYQFSLAFANTTTVHASGYQLEQPFAVGRTDNMALDFGGRTEFHLNFDGRGFELAGVIGTEFQESNSFKKSYALDGSLRGDFQVKALQSNTFTQWDLRLPYEFTFTAGASLNAVHYNIQDRIPNLPDRPHLIQSGVRDFPAVITPRVALLKTLARYWSAYAQVSAGYSPPTATGVVIPQTGSVNNDLKPERATLYEVGAKGSLLKQRLWLELALFDMKVRDKLTSRPVTSDTGTILYLLSANAGTQSNRGVELAASYRVIDDKNSLVSLVRPFVTYAFSSFRYDDFKSYINNMLVDYSGKKVAGVPENMLNAGLDVALAWGVYLYGSYQFVDTMPLTFDNTQRAKSYSLLNAKLGYRRAIDHFELDIYAGGNNLLGSLYYTMVFLNANYAGPPPNVYLPGRYTAGFYGGANLSYRM